jgi:hypothetical protein
MSQILVHAHDPVEALTIAHELRPELPRPRVALPANDSVFGTNSRVTEDRTST